MGYHWQTATIFDLPKRGDQNCPSLLQMLRTCLQKRLSYRYGRAAIVASCFHMEVTTSNYPPIWS